MKYLLSSCVFLLSCLLPGEAAEASGNSPEKITFECEVEETYLRNNCDYCQCQQEDGNVKWTCYEDGSCKQQSEERRQCHAGEYYENGCNHCWCLGDEGIICTTQLCYTKK